MGKSIQYYVVGDTTETTETTIKYLAEEKKVQGFPYSFVIGKSGDIIWQGSLGLEDFIRQYFSLLR